MSKDDEKGIYRVDTVPPPPGESDAYNAPTKVGPMAASVVAEMMQEAERKASEMAETARKTEEKFAASAARKQVVAREAPLASPLADERRPGAPSPALASVVEETFGAAAPALHGEPAPMEIPRLYDDMESDDAATLLSRSAKPPVVEPIVDRAEPHILGVPDVAPQPSFEPPPPPSMPLQAPIPVATPRHAAPVAPLPHPVARFAIAMLVVAIAVAIYVFYVR